MLYSLLSELMTERQLPQLLQIRNAAHYSNHTSSFPTSHISLLASPIAQAQNRAEVQPAWMSCQLYACPYLNRPARSEASPVLSSSHRNVCQIRIPTDTMSAPGIVGDENSIFRSIGQVFFSSSHVPMQAPQ